MRGLQYEEFVFMVHIFNSSSSDVPTTTTSVTKPHHHTLFSANDEEPNNANADIIGRRGILKSILGGAISMAAGELLIDAATTAIGGSSGAIATAFRKLDFQRVLRFGTKYEASGGIASEELMSWVASQKSSAAYPEVRAWLAAQKKLQSLRTFASTAAPATAAAVKTTRRAAASGIGIEEGILAGVIGKTAMKELFSSEDAATSVGVNTTLAFSSEQPDTQKINALESSEDAPNNSTSSILKGEMRDDGKVGDNE